LKENLPSRTASWVAACRALGALLPADQHIAVDPYGASFSGPGLDRAVHTLARVPAVGRRILAASGPLLWSTLYMQVRTRVLDDVLRAFVREGGGRQVVLLGAGYDCRAARLGAELGGVTFFEVDHPSTQAHKRQVLARLGVVDGHVAYLPWDFEQKPLAALPDELGAHGHARAAPTLTIWEGVTMYLTEPAIDATMAAVRAYSAAGSWLAMSYFTRELLARPSRRAWAVSRMVARAGEPFRFGWVPAELPAWLSGRGFSVEWDRDLGASARDLLPSRAAALVPEEGRRCVLAKV
jgi:methyltransferase (TIGR00027 family)